MTLLAAFKVCCNRYTSQDDLIVARRSGPNP